MLWRVELGQLDRVCQQIDGYGITGTPVIDLATNALYVADAFGRVHALDLVTGPSTARLADPAVWRLPQRARLGRADDREGVDLLRHGLRTATGRWWGRCSGFGSRPGRCLAGWRFHAASEAGEGSGGGAESAYSAARDSLFVATGNAFRGGSNTGKRFRESAGVRRAPRRALAKPRGALRPSSAQDQGRARPRLRRLPGHFPPSVLRRAGRSPEQGWLSLRLAHGSVRKGTCSRSGSPAATPHRPPAHAACLFPADQRACSSRRRAGSCESTSAAAARDACRGRSGSAAASSTARRPSPAAPYGSPRTRAAGRRCSASTPGPAPSAFGPSWAGSPTSRRQSSATGSISGTTRAASRALRSPPASARPVGYGESGLGEHRSFSDALRGWASREDGVYATEDGGQIVAGDLPQERRAGGAGLRR